MTSPPSAPTLESHGGRRRRPRARPVLPRRNGESSVAPPRDGALSLVRMRAIEQFVRSSTSDRGISTQLLRYRVAGWNGAAADAYTDVRWAIEQLRAEHGPACPIVLVGHSMGGRAVLRAGGDPQVAAVCGLAPWTPPGEPVEHLRGRTVAILHGRERPLGAGGAVGGLRPAGPGGRRGRRPLHHAGRPLHAARRPALAPVRPRRRPRGHRDRTDAGRHCECPATARSRRGSQCGCRAEPL